MLINLLTRHWALLIASVIAAGVLLFVLHRIMADSSRGRLIKLVDDLKLKERDAAKAKQAADKASRRLEKLRANAESVKPRHGQEAAEAVQDALALQKIADDQVLVAKNLVRKLILEEFPPKAQAGMRRKYLGHEESETKPFTMEG